MTTTAYAKAGLGLALAGLTLAACSDDDDSGTGNVPAVTLQNHSVTPALVKNVMSGVQTYALISSDDALTGSPAFRYGGSADGAGLLKNADGTFTLVTNHEDNFAVSRVRLDANFKPVSGDYLMDSDAGQWRLCSATLATPAEHGFGPVFLTVGESSEESMIHGIDPALPTIRGQANARLLPALGRWNSENALPLPKDAYADKTVILVGDDDSGVYGGQVVLYVANRGDLTGGSLYVMARTDNVQRERTVGTSAGIDVGQTYQVEFRKLNNVVGRTGRSLNVAARDTLRAIMFGRVEDLDYRKGGGANGREVYFNVTGQNNTGANADYSRTKYGRVYRLRLDANDPLKGTLELLLDGDDRGATNPARTFQNLDNIYVGQGYLYTQEDPNGYGDETHDAYIYQYNLTTRELKVVMEIDHRRTAPDAAKYNVTGNSAQRGVWEYGALIDVSDMLGVRDAFVLNIQPHTWIDERFANPDGGAPSAVSDPNLDKQGSQTLVIVGLPR